jgi:hypothetical protein
MKQGRVLSRRAENAEFADARLDSDAVREYAGGCFQPRRTMVVMDGYWN